MAGVYVHIPFCRSKCAYCDFFSTPALRHADSVVDAITREYRSRIHELGGQDVATLYLGGGTPSVLSSGQIGRILSAIDTSHCVEITVEANPDDVTAELVDSWISMGVNRVSLGVQSLCDAELRAVGRRHDARRALEAIATLRRCGITNISGDIIYGLPGQTRTSLACSLNRLIDSGITHLSCYSLMIEQGSRLYALKMAGRYTEADDDLVAQMYADVCAAAAARGFDHYEISNFALPGFRSMHNSSYWERVPYLGLGPSAHSCDAGGIRRVNPSHILRYIEAVRTTGAAFEVDEESDVDRINDAIVTGLRTAGGLDLNLLPLPYRHEVERAARPFLSDGRIVSHGSRFTIPERLWIVSDAIIREMIVI